MIEKCAGWHTTNMYRAGARATGAITDLGDAAHPAGRNADGEGARQRSEEPLTTAIIGVETSEARWRGISSAAASASCWPSGGVADYAVIVPRLQRLYEWSPRSSPNHACLSWYGTGTRSTRGRSRNDTSGALRTYRSRVGYSNASHGLADAPPANRPASRRPQAGSGRKSLP
jgi:hypothetical protein